MHTLSFLAVLSRIESGDSCRKVATSIGMAYSTVWRAAKGLERAGLVELVAEPRSTNGRSFRWQLTVSDKGRGLLRDLDRMFANPQTNLN